MRDSGEEEENQQHLLVQEGGRSQRGSSSAMAQWCLLWVIQWLGPGCGEGTAAWWDKKGVVALCHP